MSNSAKVNAVDLRKRTPSGAAGRRHGDRPGRGAVSSRRRGRERSAVEHHPRPRTAQDGLGDRDLCDPLGFIRRAAAREAARRPAAEHHAAAADAKSLVQGSDRGACASICRCRRKACGRTATDVAFARRHRQERQRRRAAAACIHPRTALSRIWSRRSVAARLLSGVRGSEGRDQRRRGACARAGGRGLAYSSRPQGARGPASARPGPLARRHRSRHQEPTPEHLAAAGHSGRGAAADRFAGRRAIAVH